MRPIASRGHALVQLLQVADQPLFMTAPDGRVFAGPAFAYAQYARLSVMPILSQKQFPTYAGPASRCSSTVTRSAITDTISGAATSV